jgi:pimeloyl-ACP methyl ester carboxylesterase
VSERTEQLVDVGGHRLDLVEQGTGSPFVVLEAGSGMTARDWKDVQERIANFTHAVAYDRAGYGASDPGPLPRTGAQVVSELEALLDVAGITGRLLERR